MRKEGDFINFKERKTILLTKFDHLLCSVFIRLYSFALCCLHILLSLNEFLLSLTSNVWQFMFFFFFGSCLTGVFASYHSLLQSSVLVNCSISDFFYVYAELLSCPME